MIDYKFVQEIIQLTNMLITRITNSTTSIVLLNTN